MNEIMTQSFTDTSSLTPIEIALGVDENGMTTAKRLYEFLELDMSNYAKWFRRNILENDFAEENTDYWVFVPKDENPSHQIDSAVLRGLSSLGNLIRNTMKDEKVKPYETAIVLDSLFRQGGLILPEQFIQVPEYEQMKLSDFME